ncbi:putative TIM barrel metal-dependent hydrolase [Aspergillus homomorphus CBS 101889]|uniref:TIM barrel metal-dependent hydrolase n=1 Tax=Aspergillus homomorphus (strain CBS 101889) TaxID=1450537 RepID=A0A395ICL7_ASPHC|nr:TIM barrel metal-dependent hydrolase [Aspergillus homomorphus CBS 101889]RAL16893.1 TIM barrel metal-dependent hydrolase [Aspergillus homomorphus CBS 101889]
MISPSATKILTEFKPRASLFGNTRVLLSTASFEEDKRGHYRRDVRGITTQCYPLKHRIPPGTWDTHMHVVDPQRFPVSPYAVYSPSKHTIEEAMSFESSLGIGKIVLVQPSIYGTDNSCLLEALRYVGPSRGRAVVVIDPTTIDAQTLADWHAIGVRGVRVNLKSVGKVLDERELAETLLQHAQVIRPFGWVLQVYISLDMVPMLQNVVPKLGVKLCIDHFGGPDLTTLDDKQHHVLSFNPYALPGFSALIALLQAGETYAKISAPYRLSKDEQYRDLEAMAREFLRVAPNRVLYATDWPHTRFAGTDIEPFTESCLRLCEDVPGLADRVFVRNAEEMMGENV